jgi:TRAP-type C4-dicarboxylate transport system substrate-binding protein
MQFADDLRAATGDALDITVHSAGSLFPHAEIKGAVRNRSVPIGEFFLSRLSNEDLAFGLDSQPFVATAMRMQPNFGMHSAPSSPNFWPNRA